MQLNKNQVMEINLKDLLFYILYRWRSILIVALIGGLALCGFQYLSVKTIHDKGELTKEERQYQMDLQAYREDMESSQNTINANTRLLQGQNIYRNESIYFQLNPQNVWTAMNIYVVKADQSVIDKLPQGSTIDPADSILAAYTSPLSEATDEELMTAFGTEKPEYVGELVSVKSDPTDNTVTIQVKGATKEFVQTSISLLHSKMEMLAAGRAQEIDPHKLSLVSEIIKLGADSELSKKQDELSKSTADVQKALQKARDTLNTLEIQKEPKEPSMHLVKMAVVGFILGMVFLAILYAVLYIVNGRLHNSRDLAERYQLPILGELIHTGSLHSDKGLDKLFFKWQVGKKPLDDQTVYDNIAALIAERQENKYILVVSTLPESKLSNIKEALVVRLSEKRIDAQADILHNSEAIIDGSKADAVIIAEEKNVSLYNEMDRMVENLIISEAEVVGAIVL